MSTACRSFVTKGVCFHEEAFGETQCNRRCSRKPLHNYSSLKSILKFVACFNMHMVLSLNEFKCSFITFFLANSWRFVSNSKNKILWDNMRFFIAENGNARIKRKIIWMWNTWLVLWNSNFVFNKIKEENDLLCFWKYHVWLHISYVTFYLISNKVGFPKELF